MRVSGAGLDGVACDAFVTRCVTRSKSVTLPDRQRSGKRVTRVTAVSCVTRLRFDVVARAHIRVRATTKTYEYVTTRHGVTS